MTAYTDRSCNYGDTEGVIVINGDEITIEFIDRTEIAFLKQDDDSYGNSRYWGEANMSISTITLQKGGFLFVTEVYNTTDNSHICTFEKSGEYKSE